MARQSQPPVILLTRPEPGCSTMAAVLRRAVAVPILCSPLMSVEFLTPPLPERPFAAVIFTSRAGVAAALRLDVTLPKLAYAVGQGTAADAREAGFEVMTAGGDATALAVLIMAAPPPGPLLHLRGREVAGKLAERLEIARLETHEAVVYAQNPKPLTAEALALLQGDAPVILPLFSPRSATLFHGATRQNLPRAPLHIIAMSAAVAKAANEIAARQMMIATEPTEAAMVDLVVRCLRQIPDLNGTAPDP